jgi:hypothetical protein
MNCSHRFWYGEIVFLDKDGGHICQKCSEREHMPNIKITAEVDGKIVPLNTISTKSFEAIKALEKPKKIPIPVPVARLARYCTWPRLLFKPSRDLPLKVGQVYALDLKIGNVSASWLLEEEDNFIGRYGDIQPL